MAEIIWPQTLVDLVLDLPDRDRDLIFRKIARLEEFPKMYPVRTSGPFRGLRFALAGRWLIYYRVADDKVYLRAIYPARLP
jgi:plasmid stabilization system protein ParE